ncbi:MAG: antibiotic biosynthesis monooxygenase [candidate division Zixibacteria bacterium]|nr:antibiotic biosynthesis monooxygenase [candidate division Zixibacteria bacterium]
MISVLAFIRVNPGKAKDFLEAFADNVGNVRAENGCIEYFATVDIDTGLSIQELNADLVTVIEKWESLDALRAHLAAPHMAVYREKVKDIVEGVSLKVLKEA